MKRADILQALQQEQQRVIENLEAQVNRYKKASDIDEDDTLDPEDLSHQTEAKDLQLRFEQMLAQAKGLEQIEETAEENKQEISQGAIAVTEDMILYFGSSIPKFTFEDKQIMGISKEAPVYAEAMGKKAGEELKMGSTSMKILEIL